MRTKSITSICTVLAITILAATGLGQGPKFPKPRQERLLNDLNLLIWRVPDTKEVTVNLRVHSGAAFDPLDKEGVAILLSQVMFPDTGLFEDFEEDLGGSLSVEVTLDYIQIEMKAKSDKLVEVLEILAGATITPDIDKDAAAEAKKARIEKLSLDAEDPASIADSEIAERLYGSFPYGRNPNGTVESVAGIDFADIVFAKQRFLTADNATLSISGDVSTSFAYRAARRLMGGWKKGNGRVPSNFTLPEAPDTAPLVVNTDFGSGIEKRLAVEAVSRRDANFYAARLLSRVLDHRVEKQFGGKVHYHPHLLRGYFVMSRSISTDKNAPPPLAEAEAEAESANDLKKLLKTPVEVAEFEAAKAAEVALFMSTGIIHHWFDIDTYRLKSVDDEYQKLQKVKLA
ncbi:MAG: insulinase family protein, partial [Acidobacteriota bacterium]|nr:insulinase family protein [Acidobacteriota bacterium]